MNEKPAKGICGFFLYCHLTHRHFFRVYSEDKTTYLDYKVCAEDVKVTIQSNCVSLYEGEDEEKNRLDWSSRVSGKE